MSYPGARLFLQQYKRGLKYFVKHSSGRSDQLQPCSATGTFRLFPTCQTFPCANSDKSFLVVFVDGISQFRTINASCLLLHGENLDMTCGIWKAHLDDMPERFEFDQQTPQRRPKAVSGCFLFRSRLFPGSVGFSREAGQACNPRSTPFPLPGLRDLHTVRACQGFIPVQTKRLRGSRVGEV